jgi:SET family sugar efflux transporter-like MFS transporter
LFLPTVTRTVREAKARIPKRNKILFLGIVAFSLLYATNQSYLISLPLYLTEKFSVESHMAGWLFGTAAFLEIPVMLIAGWLGARTLLLPLIRAGGISAVLLFIGVFCASAYWQLFPLQIFNALFVGFVAALGVTWFQDLLPDNAGSASALYINCNSAGWVMGGLIVSVFAELGNYATVFVANTVVSFVAVGILFLIKARPDTDQ